MVQQVQGGTPQDPSPIYIYIYICNDKNIYTQLSSTLSSSITHLPHATLRHTQNGENPSMLCGQLLATVYNPARQVYMCQTIPSTLTARTSRRPLCSKMLILCTTCTAGPLEENTNCCDQSRIRTMYRSTEPAHLHRPVLHDGAADLHELLSRGSRPMQEPTHRTYQSI